MRFLTLALLLIPAASLAQSNSGELLARGLRGAVAGLTPVPAKDQAELLKVTMVTLARHLTFRPDGTASSICIASGRRQHVEWKSFVADRITLQDLSDADRLNGTSKRYFISFSCEAHRIWDAKKNTWDEWRANGHILFPAGIALDWKNGAWVVATSTQLDWFIPGPGPSITEPKPAAKSDGLPLGMTRGN